MDYEDFASEDAYWRALAEHQDLCLKCYAPMGEHEETIDGELVDVGCPE